MLEPDKLEVNLEVRLARFVASEAANSHGGASWRKLSLRYGPRFSFSALKIDAKAKARHSNRTAGLVVPRVINVLQIKRGQESAPEVCGVEALENFFRTIGETAVAEQAKPIESKVLLMVSHDTVRNEDD